MAKRELPEINASSMADIAFLLLTFFLIATSMDKQEGIQRTLPDPTYQSEQPTEVNDRNVVKILINAYGQFLVEDEQVNVAAIKDIVKKHVDNNGDGSCSYCSGNGDPNFSDNPAKAVIALELQKGTQYGVYLTVQNEIEKAYNELWEAYAKKEYNTSMKELRRTANQDKNPEAPEAARRLDEITRLKYKKIIAEAKPKAQQ